MDVHVGAHRLSRGEEAIVALKQIMQDAEQNRIVLLGYVLGGRRKLVNTVSNELRGLAVTDDMIEKVWLWLFFRRGPDPKAEFEQRCEQQYQRVLQQEAEAAALDALHEHARRRME